MFEGLVLAVTFTTNDTHQILGSAVMVAPGIALSVNHVVEEHVTDLRRGRLGMMCVGIASHGAQGWRVKYVTCIDGTDICILSLEYMTDLPPKRTLYQSTITTRVPAPGEQLVMAGFQAAERTFARYSNRPDELAASLFVSSGAVTDDYPRGRGVTKPWPALGVDCPSIPGMSGGPAFDARGYLVGVISSSLSNGDGQEPGPTFVAVNWPALGQPFPGMWPPLSNADGPKSLLDLAGSLCVIERPDTVRAAQQNGRTMIEYSLWR